MNRTTCKLRRIVQRSPILYDLYGRLAGVPKTRPNSDDAVFVTGFPRSGNTLAMRLLNEICPELERSTHIHTISSIKYALKRGVPTLIIVRDPKDTCSSLYLKKKATTELSEFFKDYLDYHNFVLSQRGKVTILLFNQFVENPTLLIEALVKKSILKTSSNQEGAVEKALKRMKEAEAVIELDALESQLPSPEKQTQKKYLLAQIHENVFAERAHEKYLELVQSLKV